MKNRFFMRPGDPNTWGTELIHSDRKRVRTTLRCFDADSVDELPLTQHVRRIKNMMKNRFRSGVDSKLVERWLRTRIGRPWANVCGELHRVCNGDGKVLKLADKMARGSTDTVTEPFMVDDTGLLKLNPDDPSNWTGRGRELKPSNTVQVSELDIHVWLNNRIIIQRGSVLFWGVLNDVTVLLISPKIKRASGYRQARRLDEKELEFFRSLSVTQQNSLISSGEEQRRFAKSNRACEAEYDEIVIASRIAV